MPNPIVIAHHLIWTAYGWWLPHDPRGSMSHCIESDLVAQLGELHYGRKQIQPAGREIREFYGEAAKALKHPLLCFGPNEIASIAAAIGEMIERERYTCYACAIMPDHVHICIRKHKHLAEEMITNFQIASCSRLRADGLRPTDHPVWGGPGWKVFLDHHDDVWRTIRYIEEDPIKLRLPKQASPFVKPYDNWPLHEGHRPNSPYAKRLRGRSSY